MKLRTALVLATFLVLLAATFPSQSAPGHTNVAQRRRERLDVDRVLGKRSLRDLLAPALEKGRLSGGRYIVQIKAPPVVDRVRAARGPSLGPSERDAAAAVLRSQEAAIRQARAAGGKVLFRYRLLFNGFSVSLRPAAAAALARRPDVAAVRPVRAVRVSNASSVPFIGAPQVWSGFGVRGGGMRVAVIDTGIDYTHRSFEGSGVVADYTGNDPTVVEPGTFPTAKVVAGHDFVGEDFDPFDDLSSNDVPQPDGDPLDLQGHGSHVAGTCCGVEVAGSVGRGVAPKAKVFAYKVFSEAGGTTNDIIVAALERAADPNQNGNTNDHVDVVSMSLGSDYGSPRDPDAEAASALVRLGVVVVAAAGNSGNQPSLGSAYIASSPANSGRAISVADSIDQVLLLRLTVNTPSGFTLPDGGIMAHQDWSAALPAGGLTHDLFDARAIDPPADPDFFVFSSDRQFCDPPPAGSLAGMVPIVFKGPTDEGDCAGSTKVFNAQQAGAVAVVLQSGFGGVPFGLGTEGETITIPAVMITVADGDALVAGLSPSPPTYNAQTVNATLGDQLEELLEYRDAMTDFTSEGPARVTSGVKPDISAPGFNIASAEAGTGDGAVELSGTSMSTPHVAGVAALLRQLHPTWTPDQIKAAILNQARKGMVDNNLLAPVSATVMGAGRIQAFQSARAVSLALPPSISLGLRHLSGDQSFVRKVRVQNHDSVPHRYVVSGSVRYRDFEPAFAGVKVSLDRVSFGSQRTLIVPPGGGRRFWVRIELDPSVISIAEQEFGWYYFHPNVDGDVVIKQRGGSRDTLRVPWHVAPLAASANGASVSSLDLTAGPAGLAIDQPTAAGRSFADLYLLGATDPIDFAPGAEEDALAVGARSFTGQSINGIGEGLPTGTDALGEFTWVEFLTVQGFPGPAEPVEFAVQTASVHNTTETLLVVVQVDAGADGVLADPSMGADYLVAKLAIPGGFVCVIDLSLPDPFEECTDVYFPDYTNYNANVVGLVVDAGDIGITQSGPEFSYFTTVCSLASDLPCDEVGGSDGITYTSRLNTIDPALDVAPMVCGGFWSSEACNAADPVSVSKGSAAAGANPSLLLVFPNNPPATSATIVGTTT